MPFTKGSKGKRENKYPGLLKQGTKVIDTSFSNMMYLIVPDSIC